MADAPGWRPLTALPRGCEAAAVAWRGGEPLSQADFALQVAGWRDALAAQPGTRWALFVEDSFDFATALFGAWHAGKTVIVPGDMQDDTVARLRAASDGFLGDLPGALARPAPARAATFTALDRAATRLVVYTSGTNGEPLAIEKKLAQLDAEVHALEARFGALCDTGLAPVNLAPETVTAGAAVPGLDGDAGAAEPPPRVWATVTHQHIYGLLFRVLWPLAAGRPFVAERLVFNEEIAQRIAGPAVLVASPAHLLSAARCRPRPPTARWRRWAWRRWRSTAARRPAASAGASARATATPGSRCPASSSGSPTASCACGRRTCPT
jgi:acyl-coenzyme A synthetase/AMP-(fatty) acid ligase